MKKTGTIWGRVLLSLVIAAVALGTSAFAVLAETTEAPIALVDGVSQAGLLPGSTAGSFVYYEVEYPGDAAEAVIKTTFSPSDWGLSPYLGMNVYGPDGYEGHGIAQDDGTYLELSYQDADPGMLTVQLYSYASATVPYSIVATGVPTATATSAAAPAVEPVAEPMQLTTTATGMLVGNTGGAFAEYRLAYPTADEQVSITMTYTPADPSFANAFEFRVWAPDGSRVATGVCPDAGDRGIQTATFVGEMTGEYVVQVANYSDGAPLWYTLTVGD